MPARLYYIAFLSSDGITESTALCSDFTFLSIELVISSFLALYAVCALLIAVVGIFLISAAVSAAFRIAASRSR